MTTMNPAAGSTSGDYSWIEPVWADDKAERDQAFELDLGPQIRTHLIGMWITIAVLITAVLALVVL